MVAIVMSRNSAIWRKASLKSVMRENQLKYIDAEGVRVITNSKYVAEQVKIDKGENVVMDEPKIGEEHRDGWSKIWKSWKIGKLTRKCVADSEEKLCKSILKGLAKRSP